VDPNGVYAVTARGSAELGEAGTSLSAIELRLLVLIDGRSTVAQVLQAAPLLPEKTLTDALEKLLRAGHIAPAADVSGVGLELTSVPQAESESDAGLASLKKHGYYVRILRRAAKPLKPAAGVKLNVLVVEDDPQLAKLLRMFLQMENMAIRMAGNKEQIAAALSQPPKPDLVLLDVVLPDADGFEVLAQMRQQEELKTVPVIMCTGKATREAVLNGLLRGADGYVTKPFDVEVVLKAVKTVLGLR
jgi:two-component system, OmpR family, response regulator